MVLQAFRIWGCVTHEVAVLLHFSLLCQTNAVKGTLVYMYLLWGYYQGVISCKNCWLMPMISVKAHLCWHSKYNDSMRSDTCVSFNLNSSCNSSDSAQEQGSAQASLLFWGWVTALHRCPCKSQIIGDTAWRDVRVLACAPKWLGKLLVRTDSTQGRRNNARLLSCLNFHYSALPVSCLNSEWERFLLPCGLGATHSRRPSASCCTPYNLLGPMVHSLNIILSYIKEVKSLTI